MYYQLEYDKCLSAKKDFLYEEKKEIISGVSIWLRFDPIFESDKNNITEQNIENLEGIRSLSGLVKVGYNNKTKIFSFRDNKAIEGRYHVVGYTKDIVPLNEDSVEKTFEELDGKRASYCEGVYIDIKEFELIINKYGHLFENDDWLSNYAYNWKEIKPEGIFQELKV